MTLRTANNPSNGWLLCPSSTPPWQICPNRDTGLEINGLYSPQLPSAPGLHCGLGPALFAAWTSVSSRLEISQWCQPQWWIFKHTQGTVVNEVILCSEPSCHSQPNACRADDNSKPWPFQAGSVGSPPHSPHGGPPVMEKGDYRWERREVLEPLSWAVAARTSA